MIVLRYRIVFSLQIILVTDQMSDDEFDLDFVAQAAETVKTNWKKNVEKKVEPKAAHAGSKSRLGSDPAPTHKSKRGKENEEDSKAAEELLSDEEVSITPPASPSGTPAGKGVRGAKMTKKTQKALEQLKTTNVIKEKKESRRSRGRGRGNTSLEDGLLLISDEEQESEDSIELKVRWKTDIVRVKVSQRDRMGKVMDKVAEEVDVTVGDIRLYLGENSEEQISRDSTVSGLGLSIVSVLYGRGRVVVEGEKDEGTIQVKLQTKDRRAQPVMLDIRPTDNMETVMDKFSSKSGLDRGKLKFFFDGEVLEGAATAEELELEGGECIDVHVTE